MMRSPTVNDLARAAATSAVAACWLALLSLPVHAATNGKIVFERRGQLYLTDPSTYSASAGTVTETLIGGGSQPHVSLDGSKLVFLSNAQIAVTPADSYTPQGLVTVGSGASLGGLYPRLSPDGSLVAYQAPGATGKVVITTAGCTSGNENNSSVCNSTTLDAASAFSSIHPSWYPLLAPSGSNRNAWILFVRMADGSATVGDIFMAALVVGPNGVVTAGPPANLTRSPAAYSFPAYSPDGQHIVFGKDGGLWAMNSDGTSAKQIVHDGGGGTLGLLSGKHPVWSPDSRKIAFDHGDAAGQIYVADVSFSGGIATGSNVTEMSSLDGASNGDSYPSWLPGGAAPSLVLRFDGRLRDRVGKGDASIGPDGEVDGAFTVTMPSAGLTITRLELCQQSFPCSTSTSTGGRWDTVPGNGSWVIGVAETLDQEPSPVLNGADGSINRQFGSTFKIFISDLSPSAFVSGAWFTLTAYANGAPISGRVLLTETPSSLADIGIQFWPRPPSSVPIGDVFTYDLLVRNNGPDAATNVNTITFVPAAFEFFASGSPSSCVLSAGRNVTCSLGDIPPGPVGATSGPSVKKVSIALRGLQHGKVSYSIRARAASPGDPNPRNDEEYATTTIVPEVVLVGLEVTQGIQDLANNVPLVAGKHTFVRAHLKSAGPASDGGLLSGILKAKNVATGAILGTIANSNIGGTIPAKRNPDRGQLDDSLYFEVPFGQFLGDDDWTQGRIEYSVDVNNARVSCAEPDNNPNDCKASVTFQVQQPLSIKFVGITWTDAAGTTHTPTLANVFQAMSEILGVFPISAFDIDLGVMTTALDPCLSVTDASGRASDPNMAKIKAEIARLRQTDCAAGPCRSVYLGLMADQASCSIVPSNGQGTFPVPDPDPALSWGRAISVFARTDDAMPRVHEISHCTGNHHTLTSRNEAGPDPNYTPANGNISSSTSPFARATAYGFDVNQISPQRVYGPTTMDFMSYARPRWIGIYNYNKLFRFFSPANSNALSRPSTDTPMVPADRLLLVSGQVSTTTGTGQLDPLSVTSTPGTVTLPAAGSYAIRLEDSTGKELANYSFEPNHATDGDTALVSLSLPWNSSTRRVVLLHVGVPIASRQASASEPIVTVTAPNGGEVLAGTAATFSWTASDGDNDPLVYTVEYSVDGGATWKTLAVDLASRSFRADLTSLPGSVRALVRVSAHDGFHTTRDQSDAVFTVPEHAPQAAILTPEDGHLYVGDQTILLQGVALDVETGLVPNSSLTWSSNLGGSLGAGSPLRLDVSSLVEGIHVITLTARDGGGQTGTARITIQIARERPALLAGPVVVPIILDVESGAARYTTELALTNPGTSSTNVSLTYTASLGTKEGSGTVSESVPAGQQIVIPDVISYLRARGMAIPATAGAPQGGTLLVTPSGSSPEFVATARTTTTTKAPLVEGAAGLAYGGIPVSAGITGKAVIFGLRSTPEDRSNVAIFNMSADPVTVKVTAISGEGDSRSAVIAEAETLPSYGWLQHTRILDGTGISNGYVTVERVSETGSFGAYGVVNDNITSDGSYMAPVAGDFSGNTMTLPVVVETSTFRSELVLANRGSATATLKLDYVESLTSSGGAGGTTTVTVPAGEQKIIPEAVDYLRTHGVAIGAMGSGSFAGTVRVTVSGVSISDAYVGARTGARASGGGQFGLFTPPVYSGQEASSSAVIYALRSDQNNRSNVAVVHAGADGSGAVSLRLQAFDGSEGGVAKGEAVTVTLAPGQWAQPPGFFATSGVQNGYVRISRTSGSAPWLAYGVVNDGGQPGDRTGDGAYITAVPAAGGIPTLR